MRPRLALVCTEMLPVPPVRGGAIQAYIEGVLPSLRDRFEVTVVGVADPALPERNTDDGVRFVRLIADDRYDYYQQAAAFLAGESWDVIEVFNRPLFVPLIGDAARGTPIVLSLHNDMLQLRKITASQAEACLTRVASVVTISDFIRRQTRDLYPDHGSKLRTIRSGADLSCFRPRSSLDADDLARLRPPIDGLAGRPVILSVARLSKAKGNGVVIDAMKEVVTSHPEAVLLMVGSLWYGGNRYNSYVRELHQRAAPLGESVVWTGYVPYRDIFRYYLVGDIFVCASQWEEPLARVHYEAMAAGLPILTTDRGGNAEVIEPGANGLLVDPYDDPSAFAAAIRALLDDPALRRAMGQRGRELAVARYGWDRVGRELAETLAGALR